MKLRAPLFAFALGCAGAKDPGPPEGQDTDTDAPEVDADGDGFTSLEDCDDGDAAKNPSAVEVCDGEDNDCDGLIDDDDDSLDTASASHWHPDHDADGYGSPDSETLACLAPDGAVADSGDCDDRDAARSPDAVEVCDGEDNDCDGLTDDDDDSLDASTGTRWAPDRDGDGYGDADGAVQVCAAISGYVEEFTDCDDSRATVNPGAEEICDGQDTDCDPRSEDLGEVGLYDADEDALYDLTGEFQAGVKGAPVSLRFKRSGTLSFCGGTWYANLVIESDLAVVGVGGSSLNGIDGGGVDSVLSFEGAGRSSSVTGLVLSNGDGQGAVLGGVYPAGGGIYCTGASTLTVDDAVITGNQAVVGGGLYVENCTVTLSNTEISSNYASFEGGGLASASGSLSLTDSVISDNVAADYGGGIGLAGYLGAAEVSLDGVLVRGNQAAYGGGAFLQQASAVRCAGASGVLAGFLENDADEGGGVYLAEAGATLDSDRCDWGTDSEDNSPEDVLSAVVYDGFGDDETFSCTSAECVP